MLIDIGAESYPSFADPDFATAFLAADVARAAGWATRTPEAQARGLISATRLVLRLPLIGAPDPAVAEAADIPVVLQEVTAMLAADLLAKPRLFSDASGSSNIKSVKAGSASVDFFSPVAGGPPLPPDVWAMLLNAGLVASTGSELEGPMFSGLDACLRPLGGRYPRDDWPCVASDYD